ncbi:hypothetical protein V496_09252 [Pseudogymnoascus sp. VKM F-4515 (FW-2607)]|nr:hypothetical protein V496_09252 [Pseudogymnoascus sp. VKM F-4515 (FW-2607)]KFY85725.1 hypothetical protein V498_07682 [Pseudogymnoascus sp. VKM F-4517 (FW-2822)]
MSVFSIDRFIQDRDAPRAFGQPLLPSAASRRDISYATISLSVTTDAHSHACESCKSPPKPPSSVTSSTVLSRANSGFSTASKSSAMSDATSLSTAPSIDLNQQLTLDQQLLNMSMNGSNLPCIFRYITDCEHINFDDADSWSEHVIGHFGPSGPPPHALCIFCDRSFEGEDVMACWNECLEHINEHFESGTTLESSRPVFGVLKYMLDNGIITEEDYSFFCRGSERPTVPGLIPLDCEPEEIIAKKRAEEAASNRIIVSDPRRRRDQQRSTRGRKAPSTVIHSPNETS